MTYQEISDALEAIYTRAREVHRKKLEWIDVERTRLQLACEMRGHIFGRDRTLPTMGRVCVVCHARPANDD